MELTPEQLNILVDGFRQHDFTKNISLPNDEEKEAMPEGYPVLKKRVMSYMKRNYREFGIDRNMNNFALDHPVNMLTDADAQYIAGKAAEIMSDEAQTQAAVEYYFDMFGGLFEQAIESYCEAKSKDPDSLNDEDVEHITNRVVDVVNEELTNVLMQGQQFPALYEISHEMQAHEDFGGKTNIDATNFYNQWTHCKTAVGAMLSLENDEFAEPICEDDQMMQVMCSTFCETLNDADATIFRMREDGYTQSEIAEKLGYKNHSAVTKRLANMRKRWDEYMDEHQPK